ncbi:hypothetical protein B0H19DRAFT_1238866 [Mycena capillaripes]|nr:hypothetical protein B0H19DRAFT_1238866 [Mycena capillaripes]
MGCAHVSMRRALEVQETQDEIRGGSGTHKGVHDDMRRACECTWGPPRADCVRNAAREGERGWLKKAQRAAHVYVGSGMPMRLRGTGPRHMSMGTACTKGPRAYEGKEQGKEGARRASWMSWAGGLGRVRRVRACTSRYSEEDQVWLHPSSHPRQFPQSPKENGGCGESQPMLLE